MLVCNLPTNALLVEVLQAAIYNEISVAQWLGLTPKQIVKDHLGLSEDTLDRLPQVKPYILPGDPDLSKINFTETSL
jgi:oxalate decarboxylase/phosphoglucose isomerase-like protein (cupin superfamily)